MKLFKNQINKGEKRLFIMFGILNFLVTNFTLQISLLFFHTFVATSLSQIINFFIGFYLYGKKVFKLNYLNNLIFKKYLLLNICLWFINYGLIQTFFNNGFNKNIVAIVIIPFLVVFSYLAQKHFVFK